MTQRPESGKTRRTFLESTNFPALFQAAYERWRTHLTPGEQRRAQTVMANRLGLSDTKNIRNWMQGVSAPASPDAWAPLRALLAEAPANAELLPALDDAFARARNVSPTEKLSVERHVPSLVWRAGRSLPSILGLMEFRLRLGSNAGPDSDACPVHAVLIPGQSEREVDGRTLQIGFRHLLLSFDNPDHTLREDSILGTGERTMPGVTRISGGWRLGPLEDTIVLLRDPAGGAQLLILEGSGRDAKPTVFNLIVESGGLDVRDPARTTRPPIEGRKKSAVVDAIFRERRDPEGTGRWIIGRGEVWQDEEP